MKELVELSDRIRRSARGALIGAVMIPAGFLILVTLEPVLGSLLLGMGFGGVLFGTAKAYLSSRQLSKLVEGD